MNYMLDKIKLHKNGKKIIEVGEKITKELEENNGLDASEKLMSMELALALLNYDLFKISGDDRK